jgi:DNA-binding transcriptional LysR family regulator
MADTLTIENKNYHLDRWDDVRYVLAVARTGSFFSAGQALATSQSTVSRRIQHLEKRLGTKIFDRHSHGMRLTPAGSDLVQRAQSMEDAAFSIERHLSGVDNKMSGLIRISAPDGLLTHWLVPVLKGFRAAHPSIRIDLITGSGPVDLAACQADVAIRMVPPTEQRVVALRSADVGFSLFAAQSYIDAYGAPQSISDLHEHWIVDHTAQLALGQLDAWRRIIGSHQRVACHSDSSSGFIAALHAGYGIGLCPDFYSMVTPELVRLPIDVGCRASVWLLSHEETNRSARVRALLSFIKDAFRKHRGIWFCE